MLDMEWPDSWRGSFRIELRAEAISLVERGWPILPGTVSESEGADWQYPTPAHADWQSRLGAHSRQVAAWFTGKPCSLLVATGTMVDALEVSGELGRRAASLLRVTGHPAPIVAMPNGRWLFLTASADAVHPVLAEHDDVTWHGRDGYVPLPPTPYRQGVVHWRVKPEIWGWRLPEAATINEVLVRALLGEHDDGTATASAAVLPPDDQRAATPSAA
ncbi:bifunctional DNA primase/polymerase [Prauserella halophila]|uniref:Bifunctional DNA primase/polymerase n=1 Tax=Prauserella halophila TaxID=185641 RepID=A0ABN1W6Q4_9PSEU|nr:bifunctional DNA primase/polymerase [Prauserella halophila]MCP2235474.1 Bifunctional DNA primase/polymerase, N-terminal [Prauserella halophila]